jgi:predicted RNA-binding protein with PUA-like domain
VNGAERAARHWLFKSEPGSFSFADLLAAPDRLTMWDGVRNYQARNLMRDEMQPGDPVLFYHSQTGRPAAVGLAEVASTAYPDPTQFDPASRYFDPKATLDAPRWFLVDIRAIYELPRPVTLAEAKADPELADMVLVQRGTRLSVQPVREQEFHRMLQLAGLPARDGPDSF